MRDSAGGKERLRQRETAPATRDSRNRPLGCGVESEGGSIPDPGGPACGPRLSSTSPPCRQQAAPA